MSNENALLGRGRIFLSPDNPEGNDVRTPRHYVRYEIRSDGLRFFPLDPLPSGATREEALNLFRWVGAFGDGATLTGDKGHLVLAVLPAAPHDAFYGVTLTLKDDLITLQVSHEERFGPLFKDLRLAFSQQGADGTLQVKGTVTALLGDLELPLIAELTEDAGLVFRNDGGVPFAEDAEPPTNSVDFTKLELRAPHDRWAGLLALYTFDEGGGNTVFDSAGVGGPLDMTIREGSRFAWADGRLSVNDARIRTPDPRNPDNQPNPVSPLIRRIQTTGEFTVEAWIRPATSARQDESSIVSLSRKKQHRNLALEHARKDGADVFDMRVRARGRNTHALAIVEPPTSELISLVYTRDQTGHAHFFVNGVLQAENHYQGTFEAWGDEFRLSLANEASRRQDRPWKGGLYRVALYDRAMTPEEVALEYQPELVFSMEGDFATAEVTGLVQFSASGRIFVDDPPLSSVQVEGTSELHILGNPIFSGDIQLDRGRLLLNGRFDLFPRWSPLQVKGDGSVLIDTHLSVSSIEVDAEMTDFVLLDPTMAMADGELTLRGLWMGNPLSLVGREQDGRFVLAESTSFSLPFSLTLGAVENALTGAILADEIQVGEQDGVRRALQAELQLELSASGFLSAVNSEFLWMDPAGTLHELAVPPFSLYTPPLTKNVLLGHILAVLEAHADEIFAGSFHHAEDYVLDAAAPLIYLGTSKDGPLTTTLPTVFAVDATVDSAGGLFKLQQDAQETRLTLNPGTHADEEVAADYRAFFEALEAQGLRPGAARLVQQRIAERLPTPFSRVLFYHYGFDPDNRAVDLHAGMRLRVDYQTYQFVHPSDATARTGFVGSGSAFYQLGHYAQNGGGANLLGFDAFLSTLPVTAGTDIAQVGAGGLIDVQQPAFRLPHFRLFYPSVFSGSSGRVGPERVATLVGAQTLTALEAASQELLDTGAVQAGADRASFFFRGRAVVVPEVVVYVGEQALYVPVGTTVRQLYERYAGMADASVGGIDVAAFADARRPRRLIHEGAANTPAYRFIGFETYHSYGDRDIYDLPVVLGDRFVP